MKEALSEIWNMPKEEFTEHLELGIILGFSLVLGWVTGIVLMGLYRSRKK